MCFVIVEQVGLLLLLLLFGRQNLPLYKEHIGRLLYPLDRRRNFTHNHCICAHSPLLRHPHTKTASKPTSNCQLHFSKFYFDFIPDIRVGHASRPTNIRILRNHHRQRRQRQRQRIERFECPDDLNVVTFPPLKSHVFRPFKMLVYDVSVGQK